jgi:branched-chain amino acid aminotransferase
LRTSRTAAAADAFRTKELEMSFGTGKIWMNGSLVDWADATIHVGTHALHYGSAVFEGARCYETKRGSACFRLDAHVRRLFDSAKIYRMDIGRSSEAISTAILETIRANQLKACYIRPIVYRGYHTLGVNPLPCPVEVAIMVWEWGAYLGADALERGADVRISSWARTAPNVLPSLAKSSANYANSQLMKMEAMAEGYSEGIALDSFGHVSEGSGQNVFAVRDRVIYTPPLSAAILPGITRNSVITIAHDLGYEVIEDLIPREALYIADEVFFVGTAAEITPVRSIDKITIGAGAKGPVTAALQRAFFEIVHGEVPDRHGWLTYVYPEEAALRQPVAAANTR